MTNDEARKKVDEVMSFWGGYLNHDSDEGLDHDAGDTMEDIANLTRDHAHNQTTELVCPRSGRG